MKIALMIFLPVGAIFFSSVNVYAAMPIMGQAEYLSPVEPQSVLRSSVIPCFNQDQAAVQNGIGRSMTRARIDGEQCSPRVSRPTQPDRPDHESNSEGKDFQKRAL